MADFESFRRNRDIMRKRLDRMYKAGQLTEKPKLPTMRELKKSSNPEAMIADLQRMVDTGPSLRHQWKPEIQDPVKAPDPSRITPQPDARSKPKKEKTAAQKARHAEAQRRYMARKAVEKGAVSEAQANKRKGFLKALETVSSQWRELGVDVGNWLGVMTPKQSQAFVEYMEFRFSQGDFKSRYVIDTFIKDFGGLIQKGYDFKDIQKDFDSFLENRNRMESNAGHTNMYGMDENQISAAWKAFVREQ